MPQDDPFVEVKYGPVDLTAPDPEPEAPNRLAQVTEWVQFLRSSVISAIVVVPLVALIVFTIIDLRREPVIIEEFSVPDTLKKQGLTGGVVAHRLWDAFADIHEISTTDRSQTTILSANRQLDIVEPGTGISLQGLTQMLRSLLSLEQVRIGGEIICETAACEWAKQSIRIRVFSGSEAQTFDIGMMGERSQDEAFRDAVLAILEVIDPFVLAAYLHVDRDQWDRAMGLAEEIVDAGHEDAVFAAHLLSYFHGEKENLAAALTWSKKAIALAEDVGVKYVAGALGNLGGIHLYRNEPDEARAAFERMKELDPDTDRYDSGMGGVYLLEKEYDKALAAYQKALAEYDTVAENWHNVGWTLRGMDRQEEAITYFEKSISLDPNRKRTRYGWGLALLDLERLDEAAEQFAFAVEIDPNFSRARLFLGEILHKLGRDGEALEHLTISAAVYEDDRQIQLLHARVLNNLDRHEESIAALERALALEGDPFPIHYLSGLVYSEMEDHAAAERALAKALEFDPDHVSTRFNLGWALAEQKKHRDAALQFNNLVRDGHHDEDIVIALLKTTLEWLKSRPTDLCEEPLFAASEVARFVGDQTPSEYAEELQVVRLECDA